MDRASYPSDLTKEQCRRIEPRLPAPKPGGRPAKHDRLATVNAILYLVRTGANAEGNPSGLFLRLQVGELDSVMATGAAITASAAILLRRPERSLGKR